MPSPNVITNYIYLFHTDEWVLLPVYPDSIADTMESTFQKTNALSRTAPVFSYNYSGPRQVQLQFSIQRDFFNEENLAGYSNLKVEVGEDYVDTIIKKIQEISLPRYQATSKSVVPPTIAVRVGEDIFIKGVVNGQVSVKYTAPVFNNGKYSLIDLSFMVSEVDPYDADSVSQQGSFRGMTRTFTNGIYKGEDE